MTPLQKAALDHRNREKNVRERAFPVGTRTHNAHRAFQLAKQRDRKQGRKLVLPENADQVIDDLPVEEGDALHALVCGDFIFCDLLTRMVARIGSPISLVIATLSLSLKNVESLEGLLRRHPDLTLHIVLSHYFQSTNKDILIGLQTLVGEKFPSRFILTIGRSHAKVALFDYGDGGCYVIETSANLRSSGNLEQIAVFRERDLFNFHATWIREFREAILKLEAEESAIKQK